MSKQMSDILYKNACIGIIEMSITVLKF